MESEKNDNLIHDDHNHDGIDRRGFLECMAWAGTGVIWMMTGGILKSYGMSQMIDQSIELNLQKWIGYCLNLISVFAQISDSHIGFNNAANPDVTGTLRAAIAKINAMPTAPDLYCIPAIFRTWHRLMNLLHWNKRVENP